MDGTLELAIKIAALPPATEEGGAFRFTILASGREIAVRLKGKQWKKITQAAVDWPAGWGAILGGKMGAATPRGFVLDEPGVKSTYARIPKPGAVEAAKAAPASPPPTAAASPPPTPTPAPPPAPKVAAPPKPATPSRRTSIAPVVEYRRNPSREVAAEFRDAARGRGW